MTNDYPIKTIRSQFPSLSRKLNGRSVIYFDGPSGTQMVQSTIDAMVGYMNQGNANLGAQYETALETEEVVNQARQAMADFLGAKSNEIAFGMNMTSLAFDISRSISRTWSSEDEIVVTEMDHRANVDTWIEAAKDSGTSVKWIRLDTESLTLDMDNLDDIITDSTKLVAIGHASNGIGTINDVQHVAKRAHDVGAVVVVDAVHSAAHEFIDRDNLDADILLCSAYKFFGPHIGIVTIREDLFEKLQPYKITTSPTYIPDKLETGTMSFEGLTGVTGVVDFIASLGEGQTRRNKIESAFQKIKHHENSLAGKIRDELGKFPRINLYQAGPKTPKTPTIAFRMDHISPKEICIRLNEAGIFAGDGHFYAKTIGDVLDINKSGGWVRIGMAPYNTIEEVEYFLEIISKLVSENKRVC